MRKRMSKKIRKRSKRAKPKPRPKSGASAAAAESQWRTQMPSPSPGARAAEDSPVMAFAKMRAALNLLSQKAGEYCGLPPMIEGEQLIIEPTHRAYKVFQEHNAKVIQTESGDDLDKCSIVNEWWSRRHQTQIILW